MIKGEEKEKRMRMESGGERFRRRERESRKQGEKEMKERMERRGRNRVEGGREKVESKRMIGRRE